MVRHEMRQSKCDVTATPCFLNLALSLIKLSVIMFGCFISFPQAGFLEGSTHTSE